MKASRWLAIPVLLWLGWGFWSSALDHPWHLMFESGGQFFSGVARVHLDKGLGFTRGHDWIFNEDNPYSWKGTEPLEARAYGHHPPALGLSLAAIFAAFGSGRAVARTATIVSHLATLLLLVLAVGRWSRGSPSTALFTGLVVVLVPMSGFFGRNVSHEAWLLPWALVATLAYVRRIERGDDGTLAEDRAVCIGIAVASMYDWPGFYLPPLLVGAEILRRRPLSRLTVRLVLLAVALAALALGHIAWAAPDGLHLLVSGAGQRVDPNVLGFSRADWIERVIDFTAQTYTPWVDGAVFAVVVAWAVRSLAGRRWAGGAPAAFVAIWMLFGAIHVVAFPGGSWVHPYWMFYWMPAIAVAAGIGAGALWDARALPGGLRWLPRLAVVAWLGDILCLSHATLVWWLAVGAHPTGNPFIEWRAGSPLVKLCEIVGRYGAAWPFTAGWAALAGIAAWVAGFAAGRPWACASMAAGVALLARLVARGPRREIARDALLVVGLLAILLPITPRESPYDAAAVLARTMLGGHVAFRRRIVGFEMFEHAGRYWLSYPPMTSFVLLPWLLLTGGRGAQSVFNTLLLVGSAALLRRVVGRLQGIERLGSVAAIAYALGTPLLYSAGRGDVWLTMHSEANFLLLLALWLGFVNDALPWAGLALMTGAQCRYAVGIAGVAFLLRFWHESPAVGRVRATAAKLARFCLPMLLPLGATLAFQWFAFGNPLTTSYSLGWQEWGPHGPDFSPEYLRRNLEIYLWALPAFRPGLPGVVFPPDGQAIWWLSPFLLGVWATRLDLRWAREFLPAAVLLFAFYLLYWWTGFAQYGTRYVQDAFPLLVPLAFTAWTRPGWAPAGRWLVGLSLAINAYGAWVMLAPAR